MSGSFVSSECIFFPFEHWGELLRVACTDVQFLLLSSPLVPYIFVAADEKLKPHPCHICKKSFAQKSVAVAHVKAVRKSYF